MNKDFFKIYNKINLCDILKILNISKDDLAYKKDNIAFFPEKIYVEDFVSFENLKKINYLFLRIKKMILKMFLLVFV